MLSVLRKQRSLSQAALARLSGVSRATISAIENQKLTPSVNAALALARALDISVEGLFGRDASASFDKWAGRVANPPQNFWRAKLGSTMVAYPCERLLTGALSPDGQLLKNGDVEVHEDSALPENTLVLATCDPMVGLLRDALAAKGIRLLPLLRTSRSALRTLERGLVHAAGLHFSSTNKPDLNFDAALRLKTSPAFTLLRCANWEAGIAVHESISELNLNQILGGAYRWVNRPEGSSARAALDGLFELYGKSDQPEGYAIEAPGHEAVATIISTGSAQAGWTLQTLADQHALPFHPVHIDLYDLCFPREQLEDRRIRALLECVQEARFRKTLSALPGMNSTHTGEILHAAH